VSYETVGDRYHRCKEIFNVERKRRRYVAIDETVIGFFRLKKIVKNFYKRFPANSTFKTIESCILSFVALYNLKRCPAWYIT